MIIYILKGILRSKNKKITVFNSMNGTNSEEYKTFLHMDSCAKDHSVYDKTLFILSIYKEIPSLFKIGSGEKLLLERLRLVLILLENKKNDKADKILINVRYLSLLKYKFISIFYLGKEKIETFC